MRCYRKRKYKCIPDRWDTCRDCPVRATLYILNTALDAGIELTNIKKFVRMEARIK